MKRHSEGFWYADHGTGYSYVKTITGRCLGGFAKQADAQLAQASPRLLYSLQQLVEELEKVVDKSEDVELVLDYAKTVISDALTVDS